MGDTQSKGYGVITNGRSDGRPIRLLAHRASYEAFVGSIPAGMYVCRRCDTPTCIEPSHLFLGTQLENMADMAKKRRGNRGAGRYPRGVGPNGSGFCATQVIGGVRYYMGTFRTPEAAGVAADSDLCSPLARGCIVRGTDASPGLESCAGGSPLA